MKLTNIIALSTAAILCLASCEMKNELTGSLVSKEDTGAVELEVSVKQPVSQTRAEEVATNDFPVTIQGTSTGVTDVLKEYATADEVPSSITVPVGEYTISSHSPGTLWTITIDDGSEMALSYTQANLTPDAIYWYFGDNVTAITVNIKAKTVDGNTVTESRTFRKSDAAENYEEVGDAFTGGDALEIKMGTVESSTGDLTGITITTNITFENESESVEIPTTDPEEPEEPGGEDPEEPGEGAVTLNLPADVTYSISAGDAPASADAYIASEAGLDKIIVTITAGNDAFQAILVDLTMDGQSFLAENGGVDLIDNSDFGNLVSTVGSQAPTDGTKEYTFPIGTFFAFLDMTGATDPGKSHEFHITVTDKNGETATGVFKVTINE